MFSELQILKTKTNKQEKKKQNESRILKFIHEEKVFKDNHFEKQLFLQCINLPVKTNDFGGITNETVEFTEKLKL